jgi:uncharacterized protein YktB (UPF0637 family)
MFPGFDSQDFEIFSIPDFPGRMGEIRSRLRPKLLALGEDLHSAIEEAVGVPTFPHTAQHMRRRVNPPEETWVAFCRDRKGYKRWTHYRIAVSGAGVRVTVFVEDDADDKAHFGASLESGAGPLLSALGPAVPVVWYTLDSGTPQSSVKPADLRSLGVSLQRLKTVKFQAGVPLPRAAAAGMDAKRFEEWALEQVELLKPLYLAGVGPSGD